MELHDLGASVRPGVLGELAELRVPPYPSHRARGHDQMPLDITGLPQYLRGVRDLLGLARAWFVKQGKASADNPPVRRIIPLDNRPRPLELMLVGRKTKTRGVDDGDAHVVLRRNLRARHQSLTTWRMGGGGAAARDAAALVPATARSLACRISWIRAGVVVHEHFR